MISTSTLKPLQKKTLREQVYERLRGALQRGEIRAGSPLALDQLSQSLGISRTPLREALLQLENEGFVEILPRRGCLVRRLDAKEIRDLYQLIGAMEAAVIREHAAKLGPEEISTMRRLNVEMREALRSDDFDRFHTANLSMHEVYLSLSDNRPLRRLVGIWKQRLYDFPRRAGFVKQWELASCDEHDRLIDLLAADDPQAAADYVQNVHWSYAVQQSYIELYYADCPELPVDEDPGVTQ